MKIASPLVGGIYSQRSHTSVPVDAIIDSRGRAITTSAGGVGRIDWKFTGIADAATAACAVEIPRKRVIVSTHLLDRMFDSRNAGHLRVADMMPENQEALRTYDWPQNFDSLREMADAVVAYAASGGLRGAAKTLGRGGHSSMSRFFKKCGMTLPLFPRDEHALRDLR